MPRTCSKSMRLGSFQRESANRPLLRMDLSLSPDEDIGKGRVGLTSHLRTPPLCSGSLSCAISRAGCAVPDSEARFQFRGSPRLENWQIQCVSMDTEVQEGSGSLDVLTQGDTSSLLHSFLISSGLRQEQVGLVRGSCPFLKGLICLGASHSPTEPLEGGWVEDTPRMLPGRQKSGWKGPSFCPQGLLSNATTLMGSRHETQLGQPSPRRVGVPSAGLAAVSGTQVGASRLGKGHTR